MPLIAALALGLGFLLLNQDVTIMFATLAEDMRDRYVGGQPLSDVMMIVAVVAAATSLVLMLFWPRLEAPRQSVVVRQYFGNSNAQRETPQVAEGPRLPFLRYYLNGLRRVRAYLGFAS